MTKRILCVDDDAELLEAYSRRLRRQFQIESALGGEEALAAVLHRGPYAVVVADLRMPGLNGVEVARLIKERHGGIKTIILTMYDDEDLVAQAIRYGADGFMLKDVGPDELVKAVRTVAAGKAYLDPGVTA